MCMFYVLSLKLRNRFSRKGIDIARYWPAINFFICNFNSSIYASYVRKHYATTNVSILPKIYHDFVNFRRH